MKIIKKFEQSMPIDHFNDAVRDYSGYGVNIEALYNDELKIMGVDGKLFIKGLIPKQMVLSVHLFVDGKLHVADYNKIADVLARLREFDSVILSSTSLSRSSLNEIRFLVTSLQDRYLMFNPLKFKIASKDDLRTSSFKGHDYSNYEDIIYSDKGQSFFGEARERLIECVNNGTNVMLDWPSNQDNCIGEMIEETYNSPRLILLSSKPQTSRKIEAYAGLKSSIK